MRAVGLQRAEGAASVVIGCDRDGRSRLQRLRQSGAAKCILPKTYGAAPLAVLINTAGGLASGDQFDIAATAEPGAQLHITTQAAERVYRAPDATPARLVNRLTLGAAAHLHWLPQETILFEGGRLRRRLEVDMAPDARLLAYEMITFGRGAMGETMRDGDLSDQWRVRRGGRLAFADAIRLAAPIDAQLAPKSAGDGARAVATLLYVAPDAEDRLASFRDALNGTATNFSRSTLDVGVSAWDGLLVMRMVARDPKDARRLSAEMIIELSGAAPPKFWSL